MKKNLTAREQAFALQWRLREIALENGISHYTIAEETGIAQPNVNRMLNATAFGVKLETFIKLCSAIGYKITLTKK